MTPKNVRARRIALGMTVDELAHIFGVPPQTLSDFEAGRAELRNAERYRPILDALERERASRQDH